MLQTLLKTDAAEEAARILTICNACRYCEGHCAVFPAMTQRLAFPPADLAYMANLCHNCGSCYHHCQYADPHEFDVNVPRSMSALRIDTYEAAAWPRFLGRAFQRNGIWTAAVLAFSAALMLVVAAVFVAPGTLFEIHNGDFYAVLSHNVMVSLFGAAALLVLLAVVVGMYRFWRLIEAPPLREVDLQDMAVALHDTMTLKYMSGGADLGCTYPQEAPSKLRRLFHHLTFYGFLLCFAATTVGTIYHYAFEWVAPYGYFSLPNLLGTLGGLGLVVGPLGLLVLKRRVAGSPVTTDAARRLDEGLLALLFLTALTGLLLMGLRGSELLGILLLVHLGTVMALFLSMPYGKFIHGFYRLQALVGYALEQRAGRRVMGQAGESWEQPSLAVE